MADRLVAAVLPPNEGFSPAAVGAIGLVVQRLAMCDGPGLGTVVLGMAAAEPPFDAPLFRPVRLPALPAPRAARYRWGVAASLRALRPDLIEVHNRPHLALTLARRFGPVTLFLHNDPQAMRGFVDADHRDRLRRLAQVVAVSPYVLERLMDGVPADWPRPPAIVPNGLDLPPPLPGERDRLILFAGRLVREKGADAFVAACAQALPQLPGWRAEVIGARRLRPGGRPDGYGVALQRAAANAGVVMTGHRPQACVMDAMRRAAIIVVPSRWPEPFGLTALEAMACGAALVCSPYGNLRELAGDAALLVDPDGPALPRALLALANDPARRAALAAAGLQRARAFGMAAAAAALDLVRREALASASPPLP